MTASETRAPVAPVVAPSTARVLRHTLFDRIYHWLMAASVLILMGTAFLRHELSDFHELAPSVHRRAFQARKIDAVE